MTEVLNKFLSSNFTLDSTQLISLLLIVFCFSGVFGFIYEIIFYYLNSDRKTWYMRGSNFLPWINIYAFGSIIIFICTYHFRTNPFLVFIISVISTGLLEYFTGLVFDKVFNKRLWDYNTEKWNFMNIGGYFCLRSVLIFGLCGLFLMYCVVPTILLLSENIDKKTFLIISIVIFSIFIIDLIYNALICKLIHKPNAVEIYKKKGIKYMKY